MLLYTRTCSRLSLTLSVLPSGALTPARRFHTPFPLLCCILLSFLVRHPVAVCSLAPSPIVLQRYRSLPAAAAMSKRHSREQEHAVGGLLHIKAGRRHVTMTRRHGTKCLGGGLRPSLPAPAPCAGHPCFPTSSTSHHPACPCPCPRPARLRRRRRPTARSRRRASSSLRSPPSAVPLMMSSCVAQLDRQLPSC
jgi:hypothetical protein